MTRNNFDFLRLFFALFVVVSHSYVLIGQEEDALYHFTNGQTAFSFLGVHGFMVISGYLIFRSYLRSESCLEFIYKRILRIFPALIVVVIMSAFLVGPFFTELSLKNYLQDSQLYKYVVLNITGVFTGGMSYKLPAVFSNNPYKEAVNGCLWTIPYEFLFYLFVASFFLTRKVNSVLLLLLCAVFLALISVYFGVAENDLRAIKWPIPYTAFSVFYIVELGCFFLMGCLLTFCDFEGRSKTSAWVFIGSVILILVSLSFAFFSIIKIVVYPIAVVSFAFMRLPRINEIGKIGDLSYGVYLYSFVIQQVLASIFQLNVVEMVLYSGILSMVAAFLSWHLIEKTALRYKNRLIMRAAN